MPETNNQILVSLGFDIPELDKQLNMFAKKFRTSINDALKNITVDLGKIAPSFKLKLDLSDAKKQIEDFRNGIKPLTVEVKASGNTSRASSATTLDPSSITINPGIISRSKQDVESLRQSFISLGATEKEAGSALSEIVTKLSQVEKVEKDIARNREALKKSLPTGTPLPGYTNAQITNLNKADVLLDEIYRTMQALKAANPFATSVPSIDSLSKLISEHKRLQSAIVADETALEGLKRSLHDAGLPLVDVERKTVAFERAIVNSKVRLDQLETELNQAKPDLDSLAGSFGRLSIAIDKTGRTIKEADVGHIVNSDEVQKADAFLKNFPFKLGLIGYGLQNMGRQLQGAAQQMFALAQQSAELTEPLERIRNLLLQDPSLDEGERAFIGAEMRRLADLPGSSLEATAKAFRNLRTLNLELQDTLDLVEGLSKATALSGVGPEGITAISAQLREFKASGQLKKSDVKNIIEQGGQPVSNILKQNFGSLDAEALVSAGPNAVIRALIDGLKAVQAPLLTTTDRLNRIKNSLLEIGAVFNQIIGPGLENLGSLLKTKLEPILKAIGDKFKSLSDPAKQAISNFLVSIPIVLTALGGLLTVLGAVAIGVAVVGSALKGWKSISIAVAESIGVAAKEFSLLTFIGTKFTGVLASITTLFESGIIAGFARLLGFTTPIGIAINLIIALATNFGGLRDRVVDGVSDIIASLGKLFSTLSSGRLGSFLGGLLGAVGDLLAGIVGIIGSALNGILSLVANIIDLVTDIIDAFSADSFTDFLYRLWNAVASFLVRVYNTVVQFVTRIIVSLARMINDMFKRLPASVSKWLGVDKMDETIKGLDDFANGLDKVKVSVKGTSLVFEQSTVAMDTNEAAIKRNIQNVKDQQEAYDKLSGAIEKASDKMAKVVSDTNIKNLDTQLTDVQSRISELTTEITNQLKTVGSPQLVDEMWRNYGNKLKDLVAEGNKIRAELSAEKQLERVQQMGKEEDNVLSTARRAAISAGESLRGSGSASNSYLINLLGEIPIAKNAKILTDLLNDYDAALKEIKKDSDFGDLMASQGHQTEVWRLTEEQYKNLLQVSTMVRNEMKLAVADVPSLQTAIRKSQDTIQRSVESRKKELRDYAVDLDKKDELQQKDTTIADKQAAIAELETKVSQFLLTRTKARKERTQLEIDIAQMQRDKDLAGLAAEQGKLLPGDEAGAASIQSRIENTIKESEKRITKIKADALTEQKQDNEKATDTRLKRLADAAKTATEVIGPLESALIRFISLTSLDGFTKNVGEGFDALRTKLSLLGKDMPEILNFVKALSGAQGLSGDDLINKFITPFTQLKRAPLEQELSATLRELRQNIQAIILDQVTDPDGAINGAQFSPFLIELLGLSSDNLPKTKEEIINKIQELGLGQIMRFATKSEGTDLSVTAEFEALLGLLAKAKATQGEIDKVELSTRQDLLKKIQDSARQIQEERINSQLNDVNTRIAKIDADNQDRIVKKDLDVKNKLLRQKIEFEFQLRDLDAVYKALALAREEVDSERKKQIWEDLKNERIRIKAEEEQRIFELGQGKGTLTPTSTPGVANTGDLSGTLNDVAESGGVFANISKNLGDTSGLDTFAQRVHAIAGAFDATLSSARDARGEIANFLDSLANGDRMLDTFQAVIDGNATSLDLLKVTAMSAAAAIGQAFATALREALFEGQNFFKAFTKALGDALVNMGLALIATATAAVIMGLITGIFTQKWDDFGKAVAALPLALAEGGTLIALGTLMGGGGGSAAKSTSTSTANATNSQTGASGQDTYDPEKDKLLAYQKAMKTEIYLEIRSDDSQIIKSVVKAVNQNTRLTTLIGNRKLNFGY